MTDRTYAGILAKKATHITEEAIRVRLKKFRQGPLKPSTYPVYDQCLDMVGDALVITDLEAPFHNADFANKCIWLAKAWDVSQCILGGDAVHFDAFSGWEPAWAKEDTGGISEDDLNRLQAYLATLKEKDRARGEELIATMGEHTDQEGASTELSRARAELHRLSDQFERIDYVLGNHEGRFLRTLGVSVDPKELLRLFDLHDNPKWRIAPYYYSSLHSGDQEFRIEHPKNTAKFSAWKLAAKYHVHVIMGHSHQMNYTFDISGKYYALEVGHCVDEDRLPYSGQRHNTAYAHVPGACIVKDGHPWLLHQYTPFEKLARM